MTSNQPIHIFLADDDEDDRFFFKKAFRDSPVPAVLKVTHDGVALIEELLSTRSAASPDVIFLDINMPKKDGKETLVDIRRNEKFKYVPVIMFSTSTSENDIRYTYAHGANLYISKDFFFSHQKDVIKKLFAENWEERLKDVPLEKFVWQKDSPGNPLL